MSDLKFEEVEKLGQVESYLEAEGFYNACSFAEVDAKGDRLVVLLASIDFDENSGVGMAWWDETFAKLTVPEIRNGFMRSYQTKNKRKQI